MRIFSIDPGGSCGAVILDVCSAAILDAGGMPPVREVWPASSLSPLLSVVYGRIIDVVVIEDVVNYGIPMGDATRETLKKIGAVREACRRSKVKYYELSRPEVCLALCRTRNKVSKGMVNQVIRDRYPQTGGGAKPAIGTKKQPGPLYGVKSHAWDALALGVVWWEGER